MKQFLKYVFATVVGLGLWTLLTFVIGIVAIIGMAASEQTTKGVTAHSVMRITLSGALEERVEEENPFMLLMGEQFGQMGLEQLLNAVKAAADNDKVEGIFLEADMAFAGGSPAMLQELRQALVEFKKSGKWIYAYGDIYSQGAYYLASVADSLVVNPHGVVDWHGLGGSPVFYTDMMKKAGIKMQVFKVGTFKSAVEPYINTEMSEPNRLQVQSYLGSIWQQMLKEVGAERKLSAQQLNALADTLPALQPAEMLLSSGLVDKLAYIDEFKAMLRSRLQLKEGKSIHFVKPADVVAATTKKDEDDRVAVYYAFGDIVDVVPTNPLAAAEGVIATAPTIRELQKLRKDEDVKAVVIRVNSGGGSAFASEQIWREVQLLKAAKPVVISMGGMAASGGYYMSCGANKIFAEPTTLTGSIGIFGMVPDGSELLTEKLGLHFDVVKTNRHADFGTAGVMGMLARGFNEEEARLMQTNVERGYDLFISRVAEGRGISKDSVDAIGQGRVWTGEQALKIGLVDQLGNLEDAVAEAAKLAKLETYSTDAYPAPANFMEQLLQQDMESYYDAHLRTALGDFYPMLSTLQQMAQPRTIQQCVHARVPFVLKVR